MLADVEYRTSGVVRMIGIFFSFINVWEESYGVYVRVGFDFLLSADFADIKAKDQQGNDVSLKASGSGTQSYGDFGVMVNF